jgi:hypothetical protein
MDAPGSEEPVDTERAAIHAVLETLNICAGGVLVRRIRASSGHVRLWTSWLDSRKGLSNPFSGI